MQETSPLSIITCITRYERKRERRGIIAGEYLVAVAGILWNVIGNLGLQIALEGRGLRRWRLLRDGLRQQSF